MSKFKIAAALAALSATLSGCLESNAPPFPGSHILDVSSSVMGRTVRTQAGENSNFYQLWGSESDGTLFGSVARLNISICNFNEGRPTYRETEAYLSQIPRQAGFYMLSVDPDAFLYSEREAGFEVVILRPTSSEMQAWVLKEKDELVKRNLGGELRAPGVRNFSDIERFLTEYTDELASRPPDMSMSYLNGNFRRGNCER